MHALMNHQVAEMMKIMDCIKFILIDIQIYITYVVSRYLNKRLANEHVVYRKYQNVLSYINNGPSWP